jgi:hypothetical protein
MRHDFSVRFAAEDAALCDQFFAERLEVFDDAVVNDRHRPDDVRVSIVDRWGAVGCPARVRDADGPAERMLGKLPLQIVELPLRAAAHELPAVDGADAGAVITAIFEPLQPIEQALSDFRLADNSNDSAHVTASKLQCVRHADTRHRCREILRIASDQDRAVHLGAGENERVYQLHARAMTDVRSRSGDPAVNLDDFERGHQLLKACPFVKRLSRQDFRPDDAAYSMLPVS